MGWPSALSPLPFCRLCLETEEDQNRWRLAELYAQVQVVPQPFVALVPCWPLRPSISQRVWDESEAKRRAIRAPRVASPAIPRSGPTRLPPDVYTAAPSAHHMATDTCP